MPTINLRHLYFFMEVARVGNITATAQRIHLSQPAITQAIANVERFFGITLLNRVRAGVKLTTAGQMCQLRIISAFAQLQTGIAELTKSTPARKGANLFRSLSTSQLNALLAVVEHRTFSAASRAKGVSQPTIHRAAHGLEQLFNVSLFEKTSHGIVPTRDAERFTRKVKLAFAEIAQAQAEISALHGGESGRTVVGALPLARTFILPSALILFADQFPQHQIEIVEGTYEHLLSSLRIGEVDLFIGAMRDSEPVDDVVEEHLFDDPLSIVMRSGHPLLQKKRITVPMLAKFPWVAPRTGSPLRNHYDKLFKATGVEPPLASIECNSISAARALLLESDRIMLLSAHQIYYDLRAGMLVAIPPPLGKLSRPIGITVRQNWRPTRAQEVLLKLLRDQARSLSIKK